MIGLSASEKVTGGISFSRNAIGVGLRRLASLGSCADGVAAKRRDDSLLVVVHGHYDRYSRQT